LTIDLNTQVQKAFKRLENLSQCDIPSHELTSKLISELNTALHELQITAIELLEQNEEMVASRQTLEKERCRYQELFDFAPDGYLVTDTEGIILEANSAATALFNLSRSLLIGKPLSIFVCSEEHTSFRSRLAEIKKETAAHNENWELIMLSRKRTKFPVSITVGKVIASSGGTKELRWLLRDITKLKDTERDKRAEELVIANKELAYQNEEKGKRAEELAIAYKELAYQNEEKGKRAEELVIANKELAYQNEEKGKRAEELENAREAAETMNKRLVMTLNELAIKETEKEFEHEKLLESQKQMAIILESMTDCFLAIDSDWHCTYINRAGEITSGKSRDELLGKKITDLTEVIIFNDTALKHYHEVMGEKRVANFEILADALGNKWLEVSAYPTETGMTCYFRDITSRKKAEIEIARLDRLNLVGQLAAGIGHEIRNPMTTVRGYLQLLGTKPEYEAKKSTFDLMISEIDRANSIISEFLSLAQTKQSSLESQNLNDILNHLYPLLEADTFTQNKQINFISEDIPNLELNAKEISQMILNLTRNGLEAMQERGSLTLKSYLEDNNVVLEIADEGDGILPEDISKVGTPFFTTKESGTGLGLATCFKIAESHNAKIHIDSSTSGTTFFILFPIPEMEQEESEMIS